MRIGPADKERLAVGGTDDAEASALYVRGLGALRYPDSDDDYRNAASLLQEAVDLDPGFALAHAALGETFWQLYKRLDDVALVPQAITASDRALSLAPQLAPAHVTLGIIYSGRQEFGRALDAFERALSIDPTNVEALRQRGLTYREMERYDEAEADFQRVLDLRPNYLPGYNGLASVYLKLGRVDEAIRVYQEGLAFAPSNRKLLGNLGATFYDASRYGEAVDIFRRLLRMNPNDPDAAYSLATASFYLGDFEEAADLYERVLAAYPANYEVRQYLGDALWWAGDRARATAVFRAAIRDTWPHLSVSRSPDVIGALAGAYAKLQVRDSALAYIRELQAGSPPDQVEPVLAFGIGENYEILGDRDEALRWIQSARKRGYGEVYVTRSPWLRGLRSPPLPTTDPDAQRVSRCPTPHVLPRPSPPLMSPLHTSDLPPALATIALLMVSACATQGDPQPTDVEQQQSEMPPDPNVSITLTFNPSDSTCTYAVKGDLESDPNSPTKRFQVKRPTGNGAIKIEFGYIVSGANPPPISYGLAAISPDSLGHHLAVNGNRPPVLISSDTLDVINTRPHKKDETVAHEQIYPIDLFCVVRDSNWEDHCIPAGMGEIQITANEPLVTTGGPKMKVVD